MRKYELLVSFNPDLSEQAAKSEVEKVSALLTSHKAVEIKIDNWGRRECSYRVKGQKFGWWALFTFRSENSTLSKNTLSTLKITDSVLKFSVVKIKERTKKFKVNPKRKAAPVTEFVAAGFEGIDSDY